MHEKAQTKSWWSRQPWMGLLLFALALVAYTQQLGLARLPENFPPARAQYPLRVEELRIETREQLRFLAETLPVDSEWTLRDAQGELYTTRLLARHNPLQKALTLLSGTAFFLIAILVFGPRARDPRVREFRHAGIAYGAAVLTGGIYYPRGDLLLTLLGIGHLAALMAAPVYFLRVGLSFPRAHRWRSEQPWLARTAALACGGVFLWQVFAYSLYFAESTPVRAAAITAARHAADLLLILVVALSCGILFHSSRHLELTREREEARWILWGIAIGVTPYVFLRSLPELLGMSALLPAELDRVAELAIPASFLIALFRYRLVDIDRLIRESLVIGAVGMLVLVAYALLSRLILPETGIEHAARIALLPLAVGIVAGVALQPLREAIGRWVDRTLFRAQFEQSQDLERLAGILREQRTIDAMCVHLVRFIERRLAPEPLSVMLEDRGQLRIAGAFPPLSARPLFDQLRERASEEASLFAAADSTTQPEIEVGGHLPHGLTQHGIELVQLLRRNERTVGVILLGAQSSGRRYAKAELELLSELGRMAGRNHERLQLSLAMIEESQRAAQLDEIDHFRRDFLSRVAHDLRTPLASISWGTDNLLDGLAGELSERQRSYLDSMQIASKHLQRMLNNLLELSRLENPREQLRMESVDLVVLCENACQALAPLAAQRRIQMQLSAPQRALVEVDPDRMLEALMNLLDNAIRYSGDGATVELDIEERDGELQLKVRDHGPGIDAELLPQIFAPYRQGTPSPHSQRHGFGLGLHVTHALLERMGAGIEAGNADGGGAEFRIVFAPEAREET